MYQEANYCCSDRPHLGLFYIRKEISHPAREISVQNRRIFEDSDAVKSLLHLSAKKPVPRSDTFAWK